MKIHFAYDNYWKSKDGVINIIPTIYISPSKPRYYFAINLAFAGFIFAIGFNKW